MNNNLKDKNLEDICGKENPFSVPEGYFEHFTQQLMEKLPQKEISSDIPHYNHTTTWQRIKPWFYMAAMFCGIIAGARYIIGPTVHQAHITSRTASEYSERSYDEEYLEDALMNSHMDDYSVYCYLTDVDSAS